MKKLLAFALILMIILFAAGCSNFKNEAEEPSAVLEEETEVSEDIDTAGEDSADLSSETAENLDKDLEDFAW